MLVASDRVMIIGPMRGRKILLNNSLELGVGLLALAAGGYVLTTTILMVVECWTAVPFWDQWDNLILARDKLFWHDIPLDLPHWLFWQHNEHRIAVPRVSFAIDRFFFRMTNEWNFFCNLAVQGALAGWVVYIALRGVRLANFREIIDYRCGFGAAAFSDAVGKPIVGLPDRILRG